MAVSEVMASLPPFAVPLVAVPAACIALGVPLWWLLIVGGIFLLREWRTYRLELV